jgi:hypothetical protein
VVLNALDWIKAASFNFDIQDIVMIRARDGSTSRSLQHINLACGFHSDHSIYESYCDDRGEISTNTKAICLQHKLRKLPNALSDAVHQCREPESQLRACVWSNLHVMQ